MPGLNVTDLKDRLALQGAYLRLKEIDAEIKAIYASFPQLGSTKGRAAVAAGFSAGTFVAFRRPGPNKGRKFSAQVKSRMSEGMRKYWARRKAKQAKSPETR